MARRWRPGTNGEMRRLKKALEAEERVSAHGLEFKADAPGGGAGNEEALLAYWGGEGDIASEGGFDRCVTALDGKAGIDDPEALCAWIHHEVSGKWPSEKQLLDLPEEREDGIEEKVLSFDSSLTGLAYKVLDDDEGIIRTIVSVTGLVDRVKDNILPGAYKDTLGQRRPKGVWSHDWDMPVAKTLSIDELLPGDPKLPKETRDGKAWPSEAGALLVTTQFNRNTTQGEDAYQSVKFFGEDQEWSIGYKVPSGAARIDRKSGVRMIDKMDLYEYSPVLFGAMPLATTQVKELADDGSDGSGDDEGDNKSAVAVHLMDDTDAHAQRAALAGAMLIKELGYEDIRLTRGIAALTQLACLGADADRKDAGVCAAFAAAAANEVATKYSADQERAADGKFGSGGASTPGPSGNAEKLRNYGKMHGFTVATDHEKDVERLNKGQFAKYAAARRDGDSHAAALAAAKDSGKKIARYALRAAEGFTLVADAVKQEEAMSQHEYVGDGATCEECGKAKDDAVHSTVKALFPGGSSGSPAGSSLGQGPALPVNKVPNSPHTVTGDIRSPAAASTPTAPTPSVRSVPTGGGATGDHSSPMGGVAPQGRAPDGGDLSRVNQGGNQGEQGPSPDGGPTPGATGSDKWNYAHQYRDNGSGRCERCGQGLGADLHTGWTPSAANHVPGSDNAGSSDTAQGGQRISAPVSMVPNSTDRSSIKTLRGSWEASQAELGDLAAKALGEGTSLEATFDDRIIVSKADPLSPADDEEHEAKATEFYSIPWSLGDGGVKLGDPELVDPVAYTVGINIDPEEMKFLMGEVKAGRVLSRANRAKLQAAMEAAQAVLDADQPPESDTDGKMYEEIDPAMLIDAWAGEVEDARALAVGDPAE